MVFSGTVCLSTSAPGLADYQAFYKAAADSGFIFGDPRAAKSPTGAAQAKAYAALTRRWPKPAWRWRATSPSPRRATIRWPP